MILASHHPLWAIYIKAFLRSSTCCLVARNSPAAERTRTRAEFPRASALSAPLSPAWSILCSGGGCGGGCCLSGSAFSCVCRDENARDLMVCRGRGGPMSAPGSSSLSWRQRRQLGRMPGSQVVLLFGQQGPRGAHQSLGSPCPPSVRLGLQLRCCLPPRVFHQESKRRKPSGPLVLGVLLFEGSEMCVPRTTPSGHKQCSEQHPHLWMAQTQRLFVCLFASKQSVCLLLTTSCRLLSGCSVSGVWGGLLYVLECASVFVYCWDAWKCMCKFLVCVPGSKVRPPSGLFMCVKVQVMHKFCIYR